MKWKLEHEDGSVEYFKTKEDLLWRVCLATGFSYSKVE